MNILIAPNSMKEACPHFVSQTLVGQAFVDTAPSFFEIRKIPVADGGDDTAAILMEALKLDTMETMVSDPLGRPVKASFGYADGIAVIEMANASGMKLLKPEELNPLKGIQLWNRTIDYGSNTLGSKKNIYRGWRKRHRRWWYGMLEALGVRFRDSSGALLKGNGGNLGSIAQIDCNG